MSLDRRGFLKGLALASLAFMFRFVNNQNKNTKLEDCWVNIASITGPDGCTFSMIIEDERDIELLFY
jgi:hypothetical protein